MHITLSIFYVSQFERWWLHNHSRWIGLLNTTKWIGFLENIEVTKHFKHCMKDQRQAPTVHSDCNMLPHLQSINVATIVSFLIIGSPSRKSNKESIKERLNAGFCIQVLLRINHKMYLPQSFDVKYIWPRQNDDHYRHGVQIWCWNPITTINSVHCASHAYNQTSSKNEPTSSTSRLQLLASHAIVEPCALQRGLNARSLQCTVWNQQACFFDKQSSWESHEILKTMHMCCE